MKFNEMDKKKNKARTRRSQIASLSLNRLGYADILQILYE